MIRKIRKVLFCFMVIICGLGVAGCQKQTDGDRMLEEVENKVNQKRTDIEILQKWFPNLKGLESAEWEVVVLGENEVSSVPGPSAYRACGFMILEEDQAQKYQDEYEWKEVNPQMDAKYISVEEYQENQWFYSEAWEKQVKPGYYIGKFYLSENVIWFDVVR